MKTALRCFAPFVILAAVGLVSGCSDEAEDTTGGTGGTGGSGGSGGTSGGDAASDATETKIASSMGDPEIYRDAFPDGGANPITGSMKGSAEAFSSGSTMRLKLTVSGLPANRPFGSHLHKLACADMKAGGHYQNMPFPADGSATDPTYANNMNEVWLDFVTDATGAATSEAIVNFLPRTGEAKAIMIHDTMTMSGGVAGAKLACINMPF